MKSTTFNLNRPDNKSLTDLDSSIDTHSDYEPFIRYANFEQEQGTELVSVDEPIPDNVSYASPIYYLTPGEVERQKQLENPYAVSKSCIAKEIQDNVETERREYYPIYVESDAEVSLHTQIAWIKEFIQDSLNVSPEDCTYYFSGGRSIHAHVPRLARQNELKKLKDVAKEFKHDLDPKIYERKRQFRLPGVEHDSTGLPKVEIEPEWGHDRIVREAVTSDVSPPDTYQEVLTNTFGPNVLKSPESYLWGSESESIEPGLNKWESFSYTGGAIHRKWKAHYSHPVSPYANSGAGDRSLLVAKAIDGPFSEKRESHYQGDNDSVPDKQIQTFVPCQILTFWGCDRQYQIDSREHRPVQLSKTDYQKLHERNIGEGDLFVLIGGQSRKSRVYKPRTFESKSIAGADNFKEALETLEVFDYDTGQSNTIESNYEYEYSSGEKKQTRAGRLQEQAENNSIESLSHGDIVLVVNRLLKIKGINGTRQWFREQYGDDYDESLTNEQIKSVCKKYTDLPEYHSSNITRSKI